jgi:hypothetical protein
MGARTDIETIICSTCRAVYTATIKYDYGPGGSHKCEVCGQVVATWAGKRSYSDFNLIYRPTTWKP